ncbi:hypothetical protein VOLCADRAFT_89804 [Volvox carteri f. nagariensis]|uniref:Pherophorin domain-containing protein n=1 Tax=Volvox carteri f. nagariensis TaxID=3068 RepID=D8TSP4_VOLCA|nr:uncharacterized protein VOLCADRAFT_89804 [Volvox carteri f. nagariensis]EFJ49407.1 hypothetical protein VOLCADRAFT_89804 [Volvox carteri f. nagariensis]|eukprot:XP_002949388.1 hypothetical protein VOLCADRAFT_89804 [Volvox carteri f. nagariensis]
MRHFPHLVFVITIVAIGSLGHVFCHAGQQQNVTAAAQEHQALNDAATTTTVAQQQQELLLLHASSGDFEKVNNREKLAVVYLFTSSMISGAPSCHLVVAAPPLALVHQAAAATWPVKPMHIEVLRGVPSWTPRPRHCTRKAPYMLSVIVPSDITTIDGTTCMCNMYAGTIHASITPTHAQSASTIEMMYIPSPNWQQQPAKLGIILLVIKHMKMSCVVAKWTCDVIGASLLFACD